MDEGLLAEVRDHDVRVAKSGVRIWIGSEPTFTQAQSQHPCWLSEAVSGEKEAHARALLHALAPRLAGDVRLLRVPGRLYPGETTPRFCFGALFSRAREPHRPAALRSAELDSDELTPAPIPSQAQAWLTVTPDPAVVEVNMAPAHDLITFAAWIEGIYAAAAEVGLSPTRFRYTGELTDSGGGGQITLGGPSPDESPFFVRPQLLPGLVRYLNRHPSLSYLFAPPCCGSASQGPRADESVRERFDELPIALDYLAARGDAASPTELWSTLAPLLVDAIGSTHRAEINIEKLWNPFFAGRGQLGLVELRALRMPATPARLTALAALFRSLTARLAVAPYLEPVVDWGARLHDTFGLPFHLERDLDSVLEDIEAHGFGLGPKLIAELVTRVEPIATVALGDATLELRPAVNFWPLIGDLASQEQHGARLVDSSAARLQVLVRAPRGSELGRLAANGWHLPLREMRPHVGSSVTGQDSQRDAAERGIGSVIYRTFAPQLGLHPGIPSHDPLVLDWKRGQASVRVELYSWKPGGGAYAGLPADDAEARARRDERVVASARGTDEPSECQPSLATGWALDLRRQHR
jgi:uncharacterized protein (DUF2126 family)